MAEKENEAGEAKEDVEEQPKKSIFKFLIIGVLVIFLGVGGFMGWTLMGKSDKGGTEVAEATTKSEEDMEKLTYPLESFIVNLMDKAGLGKRYLKVRIILEVSNEEGGMKIQRHTPQLRDSILLLLSSQSFREINTIEGKIELKQALLSKINQILGDGIVHGIYFTEFVVQ
jgi:flagellar FliL protein